MVQAQVGTVMPDGTIYAGISPTTGRPMYAAPADASVCVTFNAVADYLGWLQVGDKHDFRAPSAAEIAVLYRSRNNGAFKGTFNESSEVDMVSPGDYWTSEMKDGIAGFGANRTEVTVGIACDFARDGRTVEEFRFHKKSLRCVRG